MATNTTFDTLRQPEYTGENRCTPCTIVNLGIAAAVAALLATATPALGAVAFAGFAGTIYLRGYLVPGTPTLTKRYLPDRVLAWFDKEPAPEYALGVDAESDVEAEPLFRRLDVLTVSEDGTDLELTDDFRRAWAAQLDRVRIGDRASATALASILDVDPARVSITDRGNATTAEVDGDGVGRWESHAALLADLAADRALESRAEDWARLPIEQRSHLLSSLRIFLDVCPECGDAVSIRADTVESCCRSWHVVAGTCEGCGSRLFEIEQSRLESETE